MSQLERRFEIAHEHARADWAAADPEACAARAGCEVTPAGIGVPFFNRHYQVTHPAGEVAVPGGAAAHPSIAIVVLHYLMTADGIPPAEQMQPAPACWLTFRQLPNGLFYAQAFAAHTEGLLAGRFGSGTGHVQPRHADGGRATR